jgi:hypothetical protein
MPSLKYRQVDWRIRPAGFIMKVLSKFFVDVSILSITMCVSNVKKQVQVLKKRIFSFATKHAVCPLIVLQSRRLHNLPRFNVKLVTVEL